MNARVFIPSGAGSPGFGGIFECLKEAPEIRVFAGDINPGSYGKNLADGFVTMPPGDHETYIPELLRAAKKFECNVILPVTTRELETLSLHADLLASEGLRMAVSPPDAMHLANHKGRLYDFLREQNLPVVDYRRTHTLRDLLAAIAELGFPGRKVIMKPSQGNGSRGFRIIAPKEEVQSSYFMTKAGAVFTCPEALKYEMPEKFPVEMLVCEYLPGDEYSVDLLASEGTLITAVVRLREKTVSGISVRGRFLHHAGMESLSRQIVALTGLHGPIGMQFKLNGQGEPGLLEINPRLQGAVSTCRYVGVNFPLLTVKMALGEIPAPFIPGYAHDIAFNRYWKDIKD